MSSCPSSEIRALEHSTLKVPYEILNKKFRIAQKSIDREVARVGETCNDLEKVLQQPTVRVCEIDGLVQALIDKLRGLKRKAADALTDENEAAVVLKKRIDHLKTYADPSSTTVAIQQWQRTRIDRYLMDYLLRAGYYDTACKFSNQAGVEYLTNISVFSAARDVVETLRRHELGKCLEWCYENRSKLRRTKSTLELHVREQEFIELIRRGQRLDAVRYARKYFSTADVDQWHDSENGIAHVMGLLAYGEKDLIHYRDLLCPSRWDKLIEEFREENFRLYQLNTQSVFSACLQCGLASMKTPKCFSCLKRDNDARVIIHNYRSRESDCPVCVPEAKLLAANLPYAHAAQSRLVCAYSGEAMNENNPPFVLPNGMVYGQHSLISMAHENNGKVICPRTKSVYKLEEAERVYVM